MRESFEKINLEKIKKEEADSGKKDVELTQKEKELFEKIPEGQVLNCLRENSAYSIGQLAKEIGSSFYTVGLAIKRLTEAGAIEVEKKAGTIFVEKIQPEKTGKMLEKTNYYRIKELISKNPGLSVSQIVRITKLNYNYLKRALNYLEELGLIKGAGREEKELFRDIGPNTKKLFFPAKFFEKNTAPEKINEEIAAQKKFFGKPSKEKGEEKKKLIPEERVLQYLKEGDSFSLKQISKETSLTYPIILSVLKKLSALRVVKIKHGLVKEIHPENLEKLLEKK